MKTKIDLFRMEEYTEFDYKEYKTILLALYEYRKRLSVEKNEQITENKYSCKMYEFYKNELKRVDALIEDIESELESYE